MSATPSEISLTGHKVLVTGGARGLGQAFVRTLVGAGAQVVISLTRSMPRELGLQGIYVNAIAPCLALVEATQYVTQARHDPYCNCRAIERAQLPEDVTAAVPSAHFTFSTMLIPAGNVGSSHIHYDVKKWYFLSCAAR